VLLASFSKSHIFLDLDGFKSPDRENRLRHFDPNGTEFLVKPGRVNHSPVSFEFSVFSFQIRTTRLFLKTEN
jgi:hypothetical protein